MARPPGGPRRGGDRMSGAIQDDLYFALSNNKGVRAELVTGGPERLTLDLDLVGWRPRRFAGDQLAVEPTAAGTLLTVVISRGDDSRHTFSLLIPSLLVDRQDNNPQQVETLALRTNHEAGAPGVFQHYKLLQLSGTATLIRRASSMPFREWTAVGNAGKSDRDIVVSGTCEVPGPGYRSWLQRAADQTSPADRDLRLQLTIYEPPKPTPARPTTLHASYQEHNCDRYRTVTILPEAVSIPVEYEEEPSPPPTPEPTPEPDWTLTLEPTSSPDGFVLEVQVVYPPGKVGELQPAARQGDNGGDFFLREEVVDSTAATPTTVRYRTWTAVAYTRVIILPGGPCLPVPR
jgi:hypothetical protein